MSLLLSRLVLPWVALLTFGLGAANAAQSIRVGHEYEEIPQQPIATGPKIEVVEFFWYGCPHCYQLQQPLEAWLKRKPDDVELRRIPAVFRPSWLAHARVFYTLESLGELGRLHQAVYRALHTEKVDLGSAETSADWAVGHGVDRAKYLTAYNSADTTKKVEQARSATRDYAIQGTPSLVVDGRYLTSSSMADSYQAVVVILEDLVRLARERRATK
jgi:thiol:disulfide interchange protein DsbA